MKVKLLLGHPIFNLRIWWLRVRPAPGAPFYVQPTKRLEPHPHLI